MSDEQSLEIYERLGPVAGHADARVVLSQEQRDKGRLRVRAATGEELRIFLERGNPLLVGELLRSRCGRRVRVEGALEAVATARCDDWPTFSRACYHLGNRHVRMQIGERWLRIQPDHVLEDMLRQLGLSVTHEQAVFVAEAGAYSHSHGHGHSHDHAHAHEHEHSHSHGHEQHSHSHSHSHGHGQAQGHGSYHTHGQGYEHDLEHDSARSRGHDHAHGHSHVHAHADEHAHDHGPDRDSNGDSDQAGGRTRSDGHAG